MTATGSPSTGGYAFAVDDHFSASRNLTGGPILRWRLSGIRGSSGEDPDSERDMASKHKRAREMAQAYHCRCASGLICPPYRAPMSTTFAGRWAGGIATMRSLVRPRLARCGESGRDWRNRRAHPALKRTGVAHFRGARKMHDRTAPHQKWTFRSACIRSILSGGPDTCSALIQRRPIEVRLKSPYSPPMVQPLALVPPRWKS